MPQGGKLDRCVAEVMKQGKTEEQAYAICNASIDAELNDTMMNDKGFTDFTTKIDDSTGFLEVNGVLARTGVQDYYGFELGQEVIDKYNLEPNKIYGVFRPPEEVLNQDSLDTYINKPITDNHPSVAVTKDNFKDLEKGNVSTISTYNEDGIDYVKGRITVKDELAIQKILSGKVELSAGYTQSLVKDSGVFKGRNYDFKQTNIKINHVAIVDRGRCEGQCKITADNSSIINSENSNKGKRYMAKVILDGVEHEINDCLAKHIGSLNSQIKTKDEELAKKDEDLEMLKGENAKLKEDMEEEKTKTSDSNIVALVNERVALIDTAKTLNVTVDANLSPLEIKKAIIAANSKISLDGKSEMYIDGVYETIIAGTVGKAQAVKDSQASAFAGHETKPQSTNDAYAKYVETLKSNYKGK